MLYLIRDTSGDIQIAITFGGMLKQLRLAGPDAAVFNARGAWVAGRTVSK
jgi:hypothetical protein